MQRKGSLIKRSTNYYCRIMVDGKVISRALKNADGTPCKLVSDARKAQAEFLKPFLLSDRAEVLSSIQKRLEDAKSESAKKPTLCDCWNAYYHSRERPQSGDSTLFLYQHYTSVFVSWMKTHEPQARYLEDVTKAHATEFLKSLEKGRRPATVNQYHQFLRLLFRVVTDGEYNPWLKLRKLRSECVPHQPLTQEQVKGVIFNSVGPLKTLLMIGAYTGLRLGDACLLRWEQVNMEKQSITITPKKTASRSGKSVVLPIHPELKKRFDTLARNHPYIMPTIAASYQHDRGNIVKHIRKAFDRAGINTQVKGSTVYSYHSFRFSIGQQLISNGFTLDQIAQILGHSNTTMSRHYSAVADSVKERAILSLPSIVSA